MATDLHNSTDQSTTALVGGIVEDMQQLIKQQIQLARREITGDIQKAKMAALYYTVGMGICFLGAVSLCLALAHLLHWATAPAGTDPAWYPLWACYLTVGSVLVVAGGVFVWAGEMKTKSIDPLNSPASESLKENLEWAKHPTHAT